LIPEGKISGPSATSPFAVITAQLLSNKLESASASLLRNARANASSAAIAFSGVGPASGFAVPEATDIGASARNVTINPANILEYLRDRILASSIAAGLVLAPAPNCFDEYKPVGM
jgi:hypothetical protein